MCLEYFNEHFVLGNPNLIASSYLKERNKVNPNQINLELHIIWPRRFIAFTFYGRQNISRFQKFQINLRFISQHKIVGPENIIESPVVFSRKTLKSKQISTRHLWRIPDVRCEQCLCLMRPILLSGVSRVSSVSVSLASSSFQKWLLHIFAPGNAAQCSDRELLRRGKVCLKLVTNKRRLTMEHRDNCTHSWLLKSH